MYGNRAIRNIKPKLDEKRIVGSYKSSPNIDATIDELNSFSGYIRRFRLKENI
jgi:hypothetical protein